MSVSVICLNNCDSLFLQSYRQGLANRKHLDNLKAADLWYLRLDGKEMDLDKVKDSLSDWRIKGSSKEVFVQNYSEFHSAFYDLLLKLMEEEVFNFNFSVRLSDYVPDTIRSRAVVVESVYSKIELENYLGPINSCEYSMSLYCELSKEKLDLFRMIEASITSGDRKTIFEVVKDRYDLMYFSLLLLVKKNPKLDLVGRILKDRLNLKTSFEAAVLTLLEFV